MTSDNQDLRQAAVEAIANYMHHELFHIHKVEVISDAIRFRPVIWQHQVDHTAEIALAALEAIGAVKIKGGV